MEGWRDGSTIKIIWCFCRGPRVFPPPTWHLIIIQRPLSGLWAPAPMWCATVHMGEHPYRFNFENFIYICTYIYIYCIMILSIPHSLYLLTQSPISAALLFHHGLEHDLAFCGQSLNFSWTAVCIGVRLFCFPHSLSLVHICKSSISITLT